MTVSNQTSRSGPFVATAAQTIFDYAFLVLAESDLQVVHVDSVGTEVTLVLSTDYTVTGVGASIGGTIVLVVGATAGDEYTIIRNMVINQETNLVTQGGFSADVVEAMVDRNALLIQQQQENLDRSLTVSPGSGIAVLVLPTPVALQVLRWNAAATALENHTFPNDFDISAFVGASLLNTADAAAFMTALGITAFGQSAILATSISDYETNVAGYSAFVQSLLDAADQAAAQVVIGAAGGANVTASSAVPGSPTAGDLWFQTDEGVLYVYYTDADTSQWVPATITEPGTVVVQRAEATPYSTYTSTTGTFPYDDTIPQNTEGTALPNEVTITPSSATNRLLIEVEVPMSISSSAHMVVALFQDSDADALAAVAENGGSGSISSVIFTHEMAAGTTSATTFKLRYGANTAATSYVNGNNSARRFGGAMQTRLRVTEIKV